jgi:hypothetical protein
MSDVFSVLPGIEVPVSGISSTLAHLWSDRAAEGRAAPAADEVKATQVNFILHLGFGTTTEDALVQFRAAVDFSSRYPSRVVVLCPARDACAEPWIRAKIYGECFLGKSKGDTRCCEFVILTYSMSARAFLESQVSICLVTDLPLFYWVHRFTSLSRLADYQYLLNNARRVILDTANSPGDALDFPWPNPAGLRDLAYARTLPIRQSIGQFLSRYQPAQLRTGLRRVLLSCEAVHHAEGLALQRWVKSRLADCGVEAAPVVWDEKELPHREGVCFGLDFEYANGNRFAWLGNCHTGIARFSACYDGVCTDMPSHISLLDSAAALSESMFF